jgi:hypothetical protein
VSVVAHGPLVYKLHYENIFSRSAAAEKFKFTYKFPVELQNEFHIIPWPSGIGWGHNKENYFYRYLHERSGPK